MKTIVYILIVMVSTTLSVHGQEDTSFHFLRSHRGDIVSFTIDNLDNVYLLSSTGQVKKLNANGDSLAVFNDVKRYGQASLIDVSNPLKVLLYYKDFATIVVLDRFLTIRNTIDLRKHNILQVRAIGQSYDNNIWLYDELENKLKKIDDDGNLLLETPDFRQLFDPAPQPQKIFDQDRYVYLYDSTLAVYVFDYFGTLKNKILITRWKNFKVFGGYIYGSDATNLYRYDIRRFRVEEWRMPPTLSGSTVFNFTADRVYALHKGGLDIFRFR